MKNLYSIYDNVTCQSVMLVQSASNQSLIREIYPIISRSYPLHDIELYKVGEFCETTQLIIPCELVKVEWNEYKFPMSQAENLSVFGDDVVQSFLDLQEKKQEKKTENKEV